MAHAECPSSAPNPEAITPKRRRGGHSGPSTRLSLIGRCAEGCDESWMEFFQVYAGLLTSYGLHARLAPHEAEDLVARVMEKLFKRLRSGFRIDHAKGLFRHYLKRIANREITKIKSARSRTVDLQNAPEIADSTEPNWVEAERRQRLRVCLNQLRAMRSIDPRDIIIFENYVFYSIAPEQLALENGISRARVYGIKHEITRVIRRLLEDMDRRLGEV